MLIFMSLTVPIFCLPLTLSFFLFLSLFLSSFPSPFSLSHSLFLCLYGLFFWLFLVSDRNCILVFHLKKNKSFLSWLKSNVLCLSCIMGWRVLCVSLSYSSSLYLVSHSFSSSLYLVSHSFSSCLYLVSHSFFSSLYFVSFDWQFVVIQCSRGQDNVLLSFVVFFSKERKVLWVRRTFYSLLLGQRHCSQSVGIFSAFRTHMCVCACVRVCVRLCVCLCLSCAECWFCFLHTFHLNLCMFCKFLEKNSVFTNILAGFRFNKRVHLLPENCFTLYKCTIKQHQTNNCFTLYKCTIKQHQTNNCFTLYKCTIKQHQTTNCFTLYKCTIMKQHQTTNCFTLYKCTIKQHQTTNCFTLYKCTIKQHQTTNCFTLYKCAIKQHQTTNCFTLYKCKIKQHQTTNLREEDKLSSWKTQLLSHNVVHIFWRVVQKQSLSIYFHRVHFLQYVNGDRLWSHQCHHNSHGHGV